MTPTPIDLEPHNPYKHFKFRVKWDGRYVAGVTKVSALRRTTDVVEYREGSDPSVTHRIPGQTHFEPVTLERGVSQDPEFEVWANQIGAAAGAEAAAPATFRKDVRIEVYNERGQLSVAYTLHRCWPSEYQAISDLDAHAGSTLIQVLRLENEGWERDTSVPVPK